MIVTISDCDHSSLEIEQSVLTAAGLSFSLQQNKTEDDLIQNMQLANIVLNQYAPFTERVFASLPNLKQIVRYGVGVNNIDLQAATKYGVQVCNVPDYGIHEVADHALAMMLALTRKIPFMNAQVKNGEWDYQASIPIYRHREQIVGVVGLGRIGGAFAQKVHSLGMRVIAFDPSKQMKGIDESLKFVEFVSFEQLLEQSDIISIHCPAEQAYHMFNAQALQQMKKGSYLVNVSRGGIIDEDALYKAIVNKQISGAALDVSEQEPVAKDSPLLQCNNVLITPHMAWYSEQAAMELKRKVAEEAVRFAKGEQVHYSVNII